MRRTFLFTVASRAAARADDSAAIDRLRPAQRFSCFIRLIGRIATGRPSCNRLRSSANPSAVA